MNEGQILGVIFDPNSPFLFSEAFVFTILKWMTLIAFGVYILFALVIVRQIALMTKTIKTGFEFVIKIVGYIHLLFAILIWLFAFFTL